MINFEISNSPDNNVISSFKYFQNQIYLGRSNGDLWIEDHDLRPSHLMLEVINNELLIHPQKDVEYYLINGKRATAIRKLKPNDELTVGKTIIKILAFNETVRLTKKEILNNRLNELVQESSPLLNVVERLTKLMKQ